MSRHANVMDDVASVSTYEDSVLIYLDALGFSDYVSNPLNFNGVARLMDSLSAQGLRSRELGELLTRLGPPHGPGEDPVMPEGEPRGIESSLLSDTLLMSFPVGDDPSFTLVGAILSDFYWNLGTFIHRDPSFPVFRGAAVRGPLYHKDGIVFGPALVEAYQLERSSAKYPRCIISSDLAAAIGEDRLNHSRDYAKDKDFYIANMFASDFIELAKWVVEDDDVLVTSAESGLLSWREKIVQGLKSEHNSKYEYLKGRFNAEVSSFLEWDSIRRGSYSFTNLLI